MQVLGDVGSFNYYGFAIRKNREFSEAVDNGIREETDGCKLDGDDSPLPIQVPKGDSSS